MPSVDFITQQQQAREVRFASHRPAKPAAASSTSSTPTQSTSGAAYKNDVESKPTAAASSAGASTAAPKTAADKYGSFYKTSPNGERLAKLRQENEARVKGKVPETVTQA